MGERSGKRDKELGERHVNVWEIPLPKSSLLSAPTPLSKRHHRWGEYCTMMDIDFPVIEVSWVRQVAIIDYKLASELNYVLDRHSFNNRNLGTLGICAPDNKSFQPLPFFAVVYRKDPWAFLVVPMNDTADHVLNFRKIRTSEFHYVKWLYGLRGVPFDIRVAKKLDTYIPPKQDTSLCEPLSSVIGDVETVALFDEEQLA